MYKFRVVVLLFLGLVGFQQRSVDASSCGANLLQLGYEEKNFAGAEWCCFKSTDERDPFVVCNRQAGRVFTEEFAYTQLGPACQPGDTSFDIYSFGDRYESCSALRCSGKEQAVSYSGLTLGHTKGRCNPDGTYDFSQVKGATAWIERTCSFKNGKKCCKNGSQIDQKVGVTKGRYMLSNGKNHPDAFATELVYKFADLDKNSAYRAYFPRQLMTETYRQAPACGGSGSSGGGRSMAESNFQTLEKMMMVEELDTQVYDSHLRVSLPAVYPFHYSLEENPDQ